MSNNQIMTSLSTAAEKKLTEITVPGPVAQAPINIPNSITIDDNYVLFGLSLSKKYWYIIGIIVLAVIAYYGWNWYQSGSIKSSSSKQQLIKHQQEQENRSPEQPSQPEEQDKEEETTGEIQQS